MQNSPYSNEAILVVWNSLNGCIFLVEYHMKNKLLKNLMLILFGVALTLSVLGGVFVCFKQSLSGFEWSLETRVMLYEVFSPNKEYKFGAYHYDIGAFGYSSVQASIVKVDSEFPINGNVFIGKPISSAQWNSDNTIEIISPTRNEHISNFILQIKYK